MKKILASLIILTTITCAVTGCGDKENKENESSLKSETTAISEDTKTSEVTTTVQIEEKTTVSDNSVEKVEYEELLKEFVKAYVNDDRIKTLEIQAPNGFIDVIHILWKTEEYEDYSEDEFLNEWQGDLYDDYDEDLKWDKAAFKRIVKIEPVNDEDLLEDTKAMYGCMEWLKEYVNEHGDIDSDTINEAICNDDEYIENIIIKEPTNVTIEVECEKTGEVLQGKLLVYRTNENEWKISCFYNDFLTNKTDTNYLDETSSELLKAANIAIIEMEEMDKYPEVSDYYILSSEERKNINIPNDFDYDLFITHFKIYTEKTEDIEWLFLINKDRVEYCAVVSKDSLEPVGICLNKTDESILKKITSDMKFDEIYDTFFEAISK